MNFCLYALLHTKKTHAYLENKYREKDDCPPARCIVSEKTRDTRSLPGHKKPDVFSKYNGNMNCRPAYPWQHNSRAREGHQT